MKLSRSILLSVLLLVIVAALYRIIPNRPMGFAPQYAMAIFGGAVFIRRKEWAFILPIGSMLLSDVLYEILYRNGIGSLPGFYDGQWVNYLLFAGLTFLGFLIRKINVANVVAMSVVAPTVYFILSNLFMWAGSGLYARTWAGLVQCYTLALPFYRNSLLATLFFSALFFGTYYLVAKRELTTAKA